jgi:hypothetical protein
MSNPQPECDNLPDKIDDILDALEEIQQSSEDNNKEERRSGLFSKFNEIQIIEGLKLLLFRFSTSNHISNLLSLSQMFLYLFPKGKINEFIDSTDEDSLSALIYASCFGHTEAIEFLLSKGANINIQDKNGWTPLVWATNGNHESAVKVLVENGADFSSTLKKSGMTIKEYLSRSLLTIDPNSKIGYLLDLSGAPSRTTLSPPSNIVDESIENENNNDNIFYKPPTHLDFHDLDVELFRTTGLGLGEGLSFNKSLKDLHIKIPGYNASSGTCLSSNENNAFDWENCKHDQMLVFDPRETNKIIDVIFDLPIPHGTKASLSTKFCPANVVFLCCRYASSFGGSDVLSTFLSAFCSKLMKIVRANAKDMSGNCYWFANSCQLLYYLNRDHNLKSSSFIWQVELCERIEQIFCSILSDSCSRLERLIPQGLLEFSSVSNKISPLSSTRTRNSNITSEKSSLSVLPFFNSIGSKLFSKKSDLSYSSPGINKRSPPPSTYSPKTIVTVLASVSYVMQCYGIHPFYQNQLVLALYEFIGSQALNLLMSSNYILTKSVALQIRLNISILEEWGRSNSPIVMASAPKCNYSIGLTKLVSACQFLQVFTNLKEDSDTWFGGKSICDGLSKGEVFNLIKNYKSEDLEEEPLFLEIKNSFSAKLDKNDEKKNFEKINTRHFRFLHFHPKDIVTSEGIDDSTMDYEWEEMVKIEIPEWLLKLL